jgi:hypothetical protein
MILTCSARFKGRSLWHKAIACPACALRCALAWLCQAQSLFLITYNLDLKQTMLGSLASCALRFGLALPGKASERLTFLI